MSSPLGAPRYLQGRNHLSGTMVISGSTEMGVNCSTSHQRTGSLLVSGSIRVKGSANQEIVIVGSCVDNASYITAYDNKVGIGIEDAANHSLYLYSNKSTNVKTGSIILSAHHGNATVDVNHPILEIGKKNSALVYSPSWYITDTSISSSQRTSAMMLGTETDAAASIGTIVGSNSQYTSGKLFSVFNGTGSWQVEREYTSYQGDKVICKSDYTGSTNFNYWSELLTIAAAANTSTTNTIPAGALCYAVACYVKTDIPDVTYFHIGISTDTDKWGYGLVPSASINNTTSSLGAGMEFFAAAKTVQVTPDRNPSAATGQVRIEARYITITPPQE